MTRTLLWSICLTLLAVPLQAQTGMVEGVVTDAETGEVLPGANVMVEGTAHGGVSGANGRYAIGGLHPGTYTMLASYTGYQNREIQITIAVDATLQADLALQPGIELDPLQITAGRQQEKMLEAPASITVVTGEDIELDAPATAIRALRNVNGVDIAQTGVDRNEVVLRGFNNVYSGSTYILTDYREASVAVLGVNSHAIMPSLPIDIERVEIVRGPGAALYGSGVGAGVIHYISKDAFAYPGITVTGMGGQQSLLNFQGRIAGTVGRKLGLKVLGIYGRAEDFKLTGCDDELLKAQRFSECPDPHDARQLSIDGPRDTRFRKAVVAGSAEYRFNDQTNVILNAGFSRLHSLALSGIGAVQAVGSTTRFGQVRFNRGMFFAQAYLNKNDSGDSYLYNGDPVVDYSSQATFQAQYDLHIGGDREELIMGADLEILMPNSGGTIYGLNEGRDMREFGVYAQSKTQINRKLDVVVALRSDIHSEIEKWWLSPRAAIVYKPSTTSSVRLSYNRTVSNPLAAALFLDLILTRLPLGPDLSMAVRGRGNAEPYDWNRNADYLNEGASTDLVASLMLPGMVGHDAPVGLASKVSYGFMYQGVAATTDDQLAAALIEALGLDPSLQAQIASQMATIKALLHPERTQVTGFSEGRLGLMDFATQTIRPIPNELQPLPGLKPQRSRTVEIGYKGILNNKLLLAVDAYYARKKDFLGFLQVQTPFVTVPALAADLTRDLTAAIAANGDLMAALDKLGALAGVQMTPEAAATLLVGIAGAGLPNASSPIGVVQTRQNNPGVGNLPELLMTFSNFGQINYFGVDAAMHLLLSRNLSLFGNMSWISDDFFDHTEMGEESEQARLALNAPPVKFKLGGTFRMDNGLSISTAGRYVKGFPMLSGIFAGDVAPYFLMDLAAGFDFGRGLRADLNVTNVTGNERREFIGAPKIGRIATLRLLYNRRW